jgi:hypothetical protein
LRNIVNLALIAGTTGQKGGAVSCPTHDFGKRIRQEITDELRGTTPAGVIAARVSATTHPHRKRETP